MEAKIVHLNVDGLKFAFTIPANNIKRNPKEPHFMILPQRGYVKRDWPWRLTCQKEILRKYVVKVNSFCDLMTGMGVFAKLAVRELSPALTILNDWDEVSHLNSIFNFPDARWFKQDANTFDHPQVDLATADFNTFTLNHLKEWDGLFTRLKATKTKWFMFQDSAIYGFRFKPEHERTAYRGYFNQLNEALKVYGLGIVVVGYPPVKRPNVAVVLAKAGYNEEMEVLIPKESIKISVDVTIGLGLNV